MNYSRLIVKYLMGLLLIICLSVGYAENQFEKLLSEAVAAQKKANEIGGEWRDIQKFIDESKKAMAGGDEEKAMHLARKAKTHSELGYQQALSQRGIIQIPSYLQR